MESDALCPLSPTRAPASLQVIEQAFEEVKKLKGVPGPRGPAGDILAAVTNATKAVNQMTFDAESRVGAKADASSARFVGEVSKLRQEAAMLRAEGCQLRKHLNDVIQNTVDANVVKTLQDYLLLDANNVPTYWGK